MNFEILDNGLVNDLGDEMPELIIQYISKDFEVGDLEHSEWDRAAEARIEAYWNGAKTPAGRWFYTKLLWSDTTLYVRFDANQNEPLVVSDSPNLLTKTIGVWELDVCEIFTAPDRHDPRKYFEFEVAPTGEWLDLAIDSTSGERVNDWEYASGMQSAAMIQEDVVVMAIKVPWEAFGKIPKAGDIWLGNLFRCVGAGPARGYLAWQPTLTETPNFHVPEKFGEFEFTK